VKLATRPPAVEAKDVVALVGLAFCVYGVERIFQPAGFILAGLILFLWAFVTTSTKPPKKPPTAEGEI